MDNELIEGGRRVLGLPQARPPDLPRVSVLTVENARVVSVEHRATDVVRWANAVVDARSDTQLLDALDRALDDVAKREAESDDRLLAVRVRLNLEARVARELKMRSAWLQRIRPTSIRRIAPSGISWICRTALPGTKRAASA